MPYATQEDIEEIYPGVLEIIASDDSGAIVPATVARGLEEAEGIVDSHLSVQYSLPLPVVPRFLRACAVDIAIYRMALDETTRTDEMRTRYEDCISHLKRIADGKAGLGVPNTDDAVSPDAAMRSSSVSHFVRR